MDQSRQHGRPILIQSPGNQRTRPLTPIALGSPPFGEDRVQELLALHPELLPVDELEPAFGPLICLGREIPCRSGSLDLLYTSSEGYLTLVETKLWSNPESRRKVVAQIIDYAKDFAEWDFEDLQDAVSRSEGGMGSIVDAVRAEDPDVSEAAFIDTVNRNLKDGRVLLLVVGDGIRRGVESMAEYLQQTPSLHFSLALIELGLYRMQSGEDWPLLVQPRTVVRTAELTRAVVEVRAPDGWDVDVTLPAETEEEKRSGRQTLTESAYFEELGEQTSSDVVDEVREFIDQMEERGLVTRWRSTSVSLRYPDPADTGRHFTAIVLTMDGQFYLGWIDHLEKHGGYDMEIGKRYFDGVVDVTGAEPTREMNTKPTPVEKVLENKHDYLRVLDQFIADLQGAAANSER